jgi:hypothetical protein
MLTRRFLPATLAAALFAPTAEALTIARVTRNGYILIDEPDAPEPYNGQTPMGQSPRIRQLAAEVTALIQDTPGAPTGDFIGVLQVDYTPAGTTTSGLYAPIRNDTRGIGVRDPRGGPTERFDDNPSLGTAFPISGVVALNSINYHLSASLRREGETLCLQEFAHRFGAYLRVPPVPTASADAGTPGEDAGAALSPGVLLGRQSAHWSYFMNSGGSAMEGNAWEEVSPGVFRTGPPVNRFSPLDLYVMGLVPPSEVPPFWVIAEPDVGALDAGSMPPVASSPPERSGRAVTVRGRRVTYTIDDVIRANGPRIPGSGAPDAGGASESEYRVIWVLLATPERVTDRVAAGFDQAVDSCATSFNTATGGRARLVARVVPAATDAGTDAGTDASDDASVEVAQDVMVDVTVDGGASPGAMPGGCDACAISPARGHGDANAAWVVVVAGLALGAGRTRRRRTTRSQRSAHGAGDRRTGITRGDLTPRCDAPPRPVSTGDGIASARRLG